MSRMILLLLTVVSLLDPCLPACVRPDDPDRPTDYVDLSHWMDSDSPVMPGNRPFNLTIMDIALGHSEGQAEVILTSTHFGTLLDAPAHAVKGKWTLERIPPDDLYGPCVLIDVERHAKLNRNYVIRPSDIHYFEYTHGKIPTGSVVLLNTGWGRKWHSASDFLGSTSGKKSAPGLSKDAAEFLVREREILGVGIDTFSLDVGNSTSYEATIVLAQANKWGLRNLANLHLMQPVGCELYALPIKMRKVGGAPARVIAFCEETCSKEDKPNMLVPLTG